jgi:hypothetical protein
MFGGKKRRERHAVPGAAPGTQVPGDPPGTPGPFASGFSSCANPLAQLDKLAARHARGEITDAGFGSEKHRFLPGF